jgi:hypothetical protein
MADIRQPELSLERFEALVEAYGGDLERFPSQERARAKALVLRSRDARRLLEAAHALDVLLEDARDGAPSIALEQALLEIPARHRQASRGVILLPFRSRKLAWLSAAAALALGAFSGRALPEGSGDETVEQADIASLAFADELLEELGYEEEGGEE